MTFLAQITFFEISMALLFVGFAERVLLGYAPDDMVGPNGWLLRRATSE